MPTHFPRIDSLVRDAEAAAAKEIDPLLVLQMLLKVTLKTEADPYLLVGMLVEAIASNIAQRVPAERQSEISIETMRLLRDRLRSSGVI